MKNKLTIIHLLYSYLFAILQKTFFYSILFVSSPLLCSLHDDYTFQISKFHLQCFLLIYCFTFLVLHFNFCFIRPPPKLNKCWRRELRKIEKRSKLKQPKGIFNYFVFYILENIVLIEATLILYFPLFYNKMLFFTIVRQIFLIEKTYFVQGYNYYFEKSETNNFDLINLYIKSNLSIKGKYIQISINANIETLIKMIQTIHGTNYTNIRYGIKSLTGKNVQNLLLWKDYQMHDNSEIEVIVGTLNGGGPRKKKPRIFARPQCAGCFTDVLRSSYLCLCNLCVNCRPHCLTCNCCGHDKCKRCKHGICFERCIDKNVCFQCNKCDCYNEQVDDRERDYDDKTQKMHSPQHKRIQSLDDIHNLRKHSVPTQYPCYKTQLIGSLVSQITSFHSDHPNYTLIDILEQIVFGLDKSEPSFVRQSLYSPYFLKFSMEALKSTSDVLKKVQVSKNLSLREKNNFLHTILFSMLYNNTNSFRIGEMKEIFHTTHHLIQSSIDHVNDYKLGKVTSFERQYKKKQKFSSQTYQLIDQFYIQFSVPFEGKQMCSQRKENGFTERRQKHFMPQPFNETYHYFREHPDYGPKCTLFGGTECGIPGETFFRERRPFWIFSHPQIRTGYCPYCLKMRAQLEVFRSIVKNNCSCGDNTCPTFFHQPNCPDFFHPTCTHCKKCVCEQCSACKSSQLKNSLSKFMSFLNCKEHQICGIAYPKIDCMLNLKTCQCPVCNLPDAQSLVRRFCPSVFEKN